MNIWPWSRIRELERANANLNRRCADYESINLEHLRQESALRNQVDFLIREIRKTDDIIFSIQQSADGTWATVRSRFAQLMDQMTARKVAESNRINSLITGELHKTYTPPTKQIEAKP